MFVVCVYLSSWTRIQYLEFQIIIINNTFQFCQKWIMVLYCIFYTKLETKVNFHSRDHNYEYRATTSCRYIQLTKSKWLNIWRQKKTVNGNYITNLYGFDLKQFNLWLGVSISKQCWMLWHMEHIHFIHWIDFWGPLNDPIWTRHILEKHINFRFSNENK